MNWCLLFRCQTDKAKTGKQAREEFVYARVGLINPKYAQMALTILRIPAQRLDLTDKVFGLKDIIYLR